LHSRQIDNAPGFPRAAHLTLLSLFYAVLVVYGSLVPFQYRPVPWDEAIERFRHLPYLQLGIQSRSDWVANLLLFIPQAWLLLAALTVDRRWFWRVPAVLVVVPLCFGFALLIEFTQIQFPPRTTSINDIIAETLGAVVGSCLWLWAGQRTIDWVRGVWCAAGRQGLAAHLLPGYLFFLLLVHVMPLDLTISPVELYHKYKQGRITLVPFTGYPSAQDASLKILTQLLYFAPLGLLLSFLKTDWVRRADRWQVVLLLGGLSAGLCELAQLVVFTRYSDVTDVLIGAVAVLLGWWLGLYRAVWQPVLRQPGFVAVALLMWTAVAVILEWWPLQFLTDMEQIAQRAAAVRWVLFADYYAGSDYNAFTQLLRKTLLFLPLGALLALGVFVPERGHGIAPAVLVGLLASAILEAGQLALPGRFASFTDVLVETTGAWLGAVLARRAYGAMGAGGGKVGEVS
jgi:VanZ family protein